jgi:hypothetical protein
VSHVEKMPEITKKTEDDHGYREYKMIAMIKMMESGHDDQDDWSWSR